MTMRTASEARGGGDSGKEAHRARRIYHGRVRVGKPLPPRPRRSPTPISPYPLPTPEASRSPPKQGMGECPWHPGWGRQGDQTSFSMVSQGSIYALNASLRVPSTSMLPTTPEAWPMGVHPNELAGTLSPHH